MLFRSVHGIGSALFEHMRYDSEGQPLTVTWADYLLPTMLEVPEIEIHHMESPTPLNPLGVKGAGEGGATGAPAAVMNAILNALESVGVTELDMPATPERIWRAIRAAQAMA